MKRIIKAIKNRIVSTAYNYRFFLIVFAIYITFFTSGICVSGSMEPTIMTGDVSMSINTLVGYTPKRGDIVDFTNNNQFWEKRIIGLPGDMILIRDGVVYIDGEKLNEDYLPEGTYTEAGISELYLVPDNCVFVLGDNRNYSYDSRYWENPYVETSRIVTKHLFTYAHFPKWVELINNVKAALQPAPKEINPEII